MFSLLKKEINVFFSSLIGYVIITVFLTASGLLMWVLPGELNIFDSGQASVRALFYIAPWLFLFLVPAVTMRLFSDEKRSGTIELLLTRPVTDFQIVFAKYSAGLLLVLFSLIPSLVYFLSAFLLGNPVGNIDIGGTWGSYIGLFFLAAIYVAIGVFASSITEHQIFSFVIALILSFVLYLGFDMIASLGFLKGIESTVLYIGINSHYKSMSRGVIDTRDMMYFISVIAFFLAITKAVLESRKW